MNSPSQIKEGSPSRAAAGPTTGLYVHWPYCTRICPYCDFNVYKNRPSLDEGAWENAFLHTLKYWREQLEERQLVSLYFGGGTPSLMPPHLLGFIIETAHELFGLAPGAEITLEANPDDIDEARLDSLAALGVNRISLGVQSFDDDALKQLGRNHDGAKARKAIEQVAAHFSNFTFDLIYALPEQSLAHWETTLRQAFDYQAPHMSAYQLTIEPGTAFARQVAQGRLHIAEEHQSAQFYERTVSLMEGAGYDHYEVSNFSRHNKRAIHNSLYWQGHDYIGIGPGAHGRVSVQTQNGLERIATQTHLKPESYLTNAVSQNNGHADYYSLTPDDQLTERIMMGLRLSEGITLREGDYFFDNPDRTKAMQEMVSEGYLTFDNARLATTKKGRQLLNSVTAHLLA